MDIVTYSMEQQGSPVTRRFEQDLETMRWHLSADELPAQFDRGQIQRLISYRAAVFAGLFTDQIGDKP